jgi:tight adherence protein B
MSVWLIPAVAFAAAALVVALLLYAFTAGQWRIGRRIENLEGNASRDKKTAGRGDPFPTVTSLLERRGQHSAIETALERAGLNWRPSEFVVAIGGLAVVLGAAGWLLFGALGAAGGIVLGALAPFAVLKVLQARRLREFERQLPDALMLIASTLRSGYGILRAIQAVRDEMAPPISIEFAKTLDETNVGAPTAEALTHLARRVPLPDLDIAVTAVLIQLDVGGNLAEVMEIVARTVRERQRIRAEVDTLSAEGRLSGVILFILPLAMAGILTLLNPAYMAALFKTSLGHMLMVLGSALMILGGLVINRMLQLDF